MSDDVQRIKAAINIEIFALQEYGLEFDKKGWTRCPFPEQHTNGDRDPSLHLDRSRQRIKCYSQGCFGERGADLLDVIRIMEELDFPAAKAKVAERLGMSYPGPKAGSTITATYDYRDENGIVLYQIRRIEPAYNGKDKSFVAYRPDGKDGWIKGLKGVRRVPYRLDELLKSEGTVVVVEGEKCADALWEMGIPATCNPFGAEKWNSDYNQYLDNRDVVIWPDNDGTGLRHREQVGTSLQTRGRTKSLAAVDPPKELGEGGDIADGIEKLGWTFEKVQGILDGARAFEPGRLVESCPPPPLREQEEEDKVYIPKTAIDLIANAPEIEWQVEGLLPVGRAFLLTGPPGSGKFWMSLDLALSVDQGSPWLGAFPCEKGTVLVVDEENGDALLKRRLERLFAGKGLDPSGSDCGIQFLSMKGVNLSDPSSVEKLDRALAKFQPDLVIFDTFVRIHQADESSAREMAPINRQLKQWFVRYGCAYCINHHDRKPGTTGHDSQYAFRGSSEIQAFTDSHIDLKSVKGEPGKLNVEHVKARFSKPVEPFGVEIVNEGEGTLVRHTDPYGQGQTKVEEAKNFIREVARNAGEEGIYRKDLVARGKESGHAENTLDTARKELVEAVVIREGNEGNQVLIYPASSSPPVPLSLREEEEDILEFKP